MSSFLNNYNDIYGVIALSMIVSLTSTFIAAILGLSLGIPAALRDFKFKRMLIRVTSTLMSLPPVLMGLLVYMVISRKGPLGSLHLLFTPLAMIIAQTLLVFPIIFGLTMSNVSKIGKEVERTCITLGAGRADTYLAIFRELKPQILVVVATGFGRAISEVGAVMMVGGNIKGFTRVMTTYIALETGKGNFEEAAIIGLVLLLISFVVNSILFRFQGRENYEHNN